MKRLLLVLFVLTSSRQLTIAQLRSVDSLTKAYQKTKQDTTLILLLIEKCDKIYLDTNPDSGMMCLQKSLVLSRKIHYEKGEVKSLVSMANYFTRSGDLPGALKITYDALPKAFEINDDGTIIRCYNTLGLVYETLKDYDKALNYFSKLVAFANKVHDLHYELIAYNNISRAYMDKNNLDSAYYFTKKAYDLCIKARHTEEQAYPFLLRNFGIIRYKKGDNKGAIAYYKKSLQNVPAIGNHYLLSENYRRIAEVYKKLNKADSAIYYSKKAYIEAKTEKSIELELRATEMLTKLYKSANNYEEAFNYQQIMLSAKDSLFSQQKALQIQNITFSDQQRRQEIEADKIAYQNKTRFNSMLAALGVLLLIASILLYTNRRKRKANVLLHQRNDQIETQRKTLEQTLSQLKTTQAQFIQSEKMASLGEVTAGIAHEIQNPLNFVNNFSDLNQEMIGELEGQLKSGNINEALAIAADIKQNEGKINHHGKRADVIVKGMLEHSRSGTGERQLTNINALAADILKLSYNGIQAKDKNFEALTVTNFDTDLPKIKVIPQDIGKVLLNLFNNAFYAVNQKAKTAGPDYKPTVEITTFAPSAGGWGAKIKDNGVGIPNSIKDKIMQPFFTTKPTGEGTGLGLSLTYEIAVKGHGGTIEVNTEEGAYTEFVIYLPLAVN